MPLLRAKRSVHVDRQSNRRWHHRIHAVYGCRLPRKGGRRRGQDRGRSYGRGVRGGRCTPPVGASCRPLKTWLTRPRRAVSTGRAGQQRRDLTAGAARARGHGLGPGDVRSQRVRGATRHPGVHPGAPGRPGQSTHAQAYDLARAPASLLARAGRADLDVLRWPCARCTATLRACGVVCGLW